MKYQLNYSLYALERRPCVRTSEWFLSFLDAPQNVECQKVVWLCLKMNERVRRRYKHRRNSVWIYNINTHCVYRDEPIRWRGIRSPYHCTGSKNWMTGDKCFKFRVDFIVIWLTKSNIFRWTNFCFNRLISGFQGTESGPVLFSIYTVTEDYLAVMS